MDNMVLPTAAAAPTVQAAQCRWQGIQRITDTQVYETSESSGPSVYTRRWVPVATISLLCTIHLTRPPHPLTAAGYDFIKARCSRSDEWEWHAAVHVLDAVVERAGTVIKALGRRRQPANVLMVSWDSTSALNFQRQAPRSLKLLQQRLHATIMNGCSVPPAV